MNAIATIAPGLPIASQALTEVLYDAVRNATSAAEPLPIVAPEHVKREAARRADLLEGVLSPAGPERASRWLLKLARLTARPPEDLEGAVALMSRFLADLPAFVFTGRTLEGAASAFKFWPEYRDLKIHLGTIAAPVRSEVAGLRRVAEAKAPEAARGPEQRTEAERQYVRAKVEEFRRDMAERRAEEAARNPRAHPAQALPLHHNHLIAEYRRIAAEGTGAHRNLAVLRLEHLERVQEAAQ